MGRPMHLVNTVLVVLGAWLLLAVPVALLMGRFLRAGERLAATRDPSGAAHSFDTAA